MQKRLIVTDLSSKLDTVSSVVKAYDLDTYAHQRVLEYLINSTMDDDYDIINESECQYMIANYPFLDSEIFGCAEAANELTKIKELTSNLLRTTIDCGNECSVELAKNHLVVWKKTI